MSVPRVPPRTIVDRLRRAGCIAPEAEAAELVGAAPDRRTLDAWVARREVGEPLAWIVGSTTFCGARVVVTPSVYVPRPQSEELARRAAALLPVAGGVAADLCTGAGAIAAHLRAVSPQSFVVGVDIDERAVRCARTNGVAAVVGDLGEPLRSGVFDVVTAVAPYVPTAHLDLLPSDVRRFEPVRALDGGADGLRLVRRAAAAAARVLRPGGWFLTELGADQADALGGDLDTLGFAPAAPWFDEDGDLRGLAAVRSASPSGARGD